jgi:hypothetical protein
MRAQFPHVRIKPTGFPDFSYYRHTGPRAIVFVTLTGRDGADQRAANVARGVPKPAGYAWHHHEIMGIMELVPSAINLGVSHYGGKFFYDMCNNHQYR